MEKQPLHHKEFNLDVEQKKKKDKFPQRNLVSKSVSQTPFVPIRSKVLDKKMKTKMDVTETTTKIRQMAEKMNISDS
jgi:hypothetical protein